MKSRTERTQAARFVVGVLVLSVACWLFAAGAVRAGERQFLVILANSPKQYAPGTQPPGGLPHPQNIFNQYFDGADRDEPEPEGNPNIYSFAEYWEEVSYGDVQISGSTTSWVNLPWAIQPPFVSIEGGSVDDPLDDPATRNSPHNFYELDGFGAYTYGIGEYFVGRLAATAIDTNGDPGGTNDGPDAPPLPSFHTTAQGYPVWKPGERFIDMDEDDKWDGYDEANNEMDWDGDGRPDLRGPWTDLNGDGEPSAPADCVYLADSDNDGNPDCCPDGPGRFDVQLGRLVPNTDSCPKWYCTPTRWEGRRGEITDCNGNLIPDDCDVSPQNQASPECRATGWLDFDPHCDLCGASVDNNPYEGSERGCNPGQPDGIPDECQFLEIQTDDTCSSADPNDAEDPCNGLMDPCTPITQDIPERCEYDDANADNNLDIVEPFENFLRRWDPCFVDPDAHVDNQLSDGGHWIKVYDPNTPNAAFPVTCGDRAGTVTYNDDSYIRNNYPARGMLCSETRTSCDTNHPCSKLCSMSRTACQTSSNCFFGGETCASVQVCRTGIEEVIAQAKIAPFKVCSTSRNSCQRDSDCPGQRCEVNNAFSVPSNGRVIYGRHDPYGQIPLEEGCRCRDGSDCINVTFPGRAMIENACIAGYHAQFDPPDGWANELAPNGPGETTVYSTKMQQVPGRRGALATIFKTTPKPDWFEDAWLDRYGRKSDDCPSASFNPSSPAGPSNLETAACQAPSWREPANDERVTVAIPFHDADAGADDPAVNRRYFHANFGGTSVGEDGRRVGRGKGWVDCSSESDPYVRFETGEIPFGFEEPCNHPILPEEVDGVDEPPIFYDGWVEHDDLPSSKYHRAGDQRLGEITSPTLSTYEFGGHQGTTWVVPQIWGEDRGLGYPSPVTSDGIIPAAGPYATDIHGNNGRDAGNLLTMEVLTWRTQPPFNNGYAWERDLDFQWETRFHPYAGRGYPEWGMPAANLGFRDYNLDGLIDQGEVRFAGSENYLSDSYKLTSNNGCETAYPWNRDRMVEDCIEILDDLTDFDDFVDPVTLGQVNCASGGSMSADLPVQYRSTSIPSNAVSPNGVMSGIILLPPGAHANGVLRMNPQFRPIHNEDNDDTSKMFPRTRAQTSRGAYLSWNLFFHDVARSVDFASNAGPLNDTDFLTGFAAHEYMHTWQGYPDLYDYDINNTGGIENCPVGAWDIMANGWLVHPAPLLKESACSQWMTPVDLTSILTPGVEKTLTLPPAELVRDNSYFFLENPTYTGERYYLWSAGSGFDRFLPGDGMLIERTDVGANPDALPLQQTSPPFSYEIIQADGLNELLDCSDPGTLNGDAGDPWPGTSGATTFNFNSNPAARWTTQNSWTGLDVVDVVPDGAGSVQLKLSWEPTDIPSLKFVDPPGGVSVPISAQNVKYTAKFRATDVYGGTTISLYYTKDETKCSRTTTKACVTRADCPTGEVCTHNFSIDSSGANRIGQKKKTTPGTNVMTMDWNIFGKADGRYVLFAELVPGVGADGAERNSSGPHRGRNNIGNGGLEIDEVNISTHKARFETWTVTCIDGTQGKWQVNSNITQPALDTGGQQQQDPYPRATTGTQYTSVGGEVKFTIKNTTQGTITQFVAGDTFTFTTTGITAPSASLNIIAGKISEDPVAIITATPLAGDPPLQVQFDGRKSRDPNGEPITYLWNFGDGSAPVSSENPSHTFLEARTYSVVLKVTNPRNGRFGEAAVDIAVTNNSPKAVISATPTSGGADGKGLKVQFSGGQSSDRETSLDKLIYHWDFGDGETANDDLVPGKTFQAIPHVYKNLANGTLCTHQAPCDFTATLKVIDEGGKSDSATVKIRVGNTSPVPNIIYSALQGTDPWKVIFNAINSYDAEKDTIKVEWIWGDGSPNETLPLTGAGGATDGSVPHTYRLPAGQTTASFQTKAIVRDYIAGRADAIGETTWAGVTVVVNAATPGSSNPRAIISPACDDLEPVAGEPFSVDGSRSYDLPAGSRVVSYSWDWGDGSSPTSGVKATHTYATAGKYTIVLTVADGEAPPNTNRISCTVTVTGEGPGGPPPPANRPPVALFTVDPESGFVGTEFTFDAGGSVDPDGDEQSLRYSWSFGDAQTATGKVVTHVYEQAKPEGYVVRLTVRDQRNASTEAIREVVVVEVGGNLPPIAHIASGPRTGTAPLTLAFDGRNSYDPDGDAMEFRWDFTLNDRVIDTLIGPVVTRVFNEAGSYTLTLAVSDRRGGVGTAGPETITVAAPTEPPSGGGEEPPPHTTPTGTGDSAANRPLGGRVCGFGMLPALLGSLTGLAVLAGSRRRFSR